MGGQQGKYVEKKDIMKSYNHKTANKPIKQVHQHTALQNVQGGK